LRSASVCRTLLFLTTWSLRIVFIANILPFRLHFTIITFPKHPFPITCAQHRAEAQQPACWRSTAREEAA